MKIYTWIRIKFWGCGFRLRRWMLYKFKNDCFKVLYLYLLLFFFWQRIKVLYLKPNLQIQNLRTQNTKSIRNFIFHSYCLSFWGKNTRSAPSFPIPHASSWSNSTQVTCLFDAAESFFGAQSASSSTPLECLTFNTHHCQHFSWTIVLDHPQQPSLQKSHIWGQFGIVFGYSF